MSVVAIAAYQRTFCTKNSIVPMDIVYEILHFNFETRAHPEFFVDNVRGANDTLATEGAIESRQKKPL
eukprot:3309187-Rhodomonas_salina.1